MSFSNLKKFVYKHEKYFHIFGVSYFVLTLIAANFAGQSLADSLYSELLETGSPVFLLSIAMKASLVYENQFGARVGILMLFLASPFLIFISTLFFSARFYKARVDLTSSRTFSRNFWNLILCMFLIVVVTLSVFLLIGTDGPRCRGCESGSVNFMLIINGLGFFSIGLLVFMAWTFFLSLFK